MSTVGPDVAINIKPTLNAEPVTRYIRIEAARAVSALPMEEISCPIHTRMNERLRKTANREGGVLVVIADNEI
jgi:hypothetical protein